MKENFQDFLRKTLDENDWSYKQLAELIGVTHGAVGTWIRGTSQPDPKQVRALAELANVDPVELFVMLEYLPETAKEKTPMRPIEARILRMLQPLDELILDAIAIQIKTVLIPLFEKLKAKVNESEKDSKRIQN